MIKNLVSTLTIPFILASCTNTHNFQRREGIPSMSPPPAKSIKFTCNGPSENANLLLKDTNSSQEYFVAKIGSTVLTNPSEACRSFAKTLNTALAKKPYTKSLYVVADKNNIRIETEEKKYTETVNNITFTGKTRPYLIPNIDILFGQGFLNSTHFGSNNKQIPVLTTIRTFVPDIKNPYTKQIGESKFPIENATEVRIEIPLNKAQNTKK